MLNTYLENRIRNACLMDKERESVGLIYESNKTKKIDIALCKNDSEDPCNHFVLSPYDYLRVAHKNRVYALFHSHVNDETEFSELDKINSENYNLIYILYNLKHNLFREYFPTKSYKSKYIGREFKMGSSDCFILIKDYYQNELGISINDGIERDEEWYTKNKNIFFDFWKKNDEFIEVQGFDNIRKYDCLIIQYPKNPTPSHVMLYLANNLILHQLNNKLSTVELLSNVHKKCTKKILRHQKMLERDIRL